ncbi:MAG: hypothetical protein R6U04_10785 [Bacteroidales bacterium]
MNYEGAKKELTDLIKVKALLKQQVFDNTFSTYKELRSVQETLVKNYNEA